VIAGLLLFLVLPLAVGGVVYTLRRLGTLSALLSIGITLGLGIGILVLPLGQTVELWGRQIVMGGTVSFLGRELILEEADRIAIAFLYLTASGIFTLAWQTSPGVLLFPVGLGMLSLLSGSLLIRPLIYAVLLVEIAVAVSVFALQREGRPPAWGALQYLSFSLLAMPGLLVIHWLMDRYALTPDDTTLLDTAAILLAFSFALLMGSLPFYMWMPAMASDSEPLASAFVFTVNHAAVWFLLLAFLETYPDLSAYAPLAPFAMGAGLGMVGVGGVLGASQRRIGRLLGYGALIDNGVTLIALGIGGDQGLALVLLGLLVRPFGLALMATGVKGLRACCADGLRARTLRGLAGRAPWSTGALVMGGLSMAGLPTSAGFVGRWALFRALGPAGLPAVVTMMMASGGLMIGVWRAVSALLTGVELTGESAEGGVGREREPWMRALVVTLAVVATVFVGLRPQLVAPTAARLASLYSFWGP
jgi:multicomponent Na+:H+ antiporter subunit D